MKRFRIFLGRIINSIFEDKITVYAAQVSFFVVISAIPIVMLVIPLIQFLIPLSRDTMTSMILGVLPNSTELKNMVLSLLNDIYTNSAGTIISLSTLTVLWSASKAIYCLQQGLNNIAGIKETRNVVAQRLLSILYTVVFVIVLFFSVGVLLFGNRVRTLMESWMPHLAQVSAAVFLFRTLFSTVIFMLFFIFIYAVLPNVKRKHSFRYNLPGAIFATCGWLIFSYFYALYVDHVAIFSYIYGSLTALILLMLWLYICMNIVLLGAVINKLFADRKESAEK